MTAHEILIAAKQELLTRGWAQGGAEHYATGEVCVMGALGYALYGKALGSLMFTGVDEASEYFKQAACPHASGEAYTVVALWNDDPARTPEEVLDAFDRAIALAETREAVTV